MEMIDFGMEKYFYREFDNLHVSICRFCPDLVLSGLNVIDDLILDDGELKVIPLSISGSSEPTP